MILYHLQPRIFPIKAIPIKMKPAIKKGNGTNIPDLAAGIHFVLSSFKVSPSGQVKSTI